jgi:hypothetical protein
MTRPTMLALLLPVVLMGVRPSMSRAETWVIPLFGLTERYDDNIFGTSQNRESDFITGFTVGLSAVSRSERFSMLGGVAGTAEVFAKNSDQNNFENAAGNVALQYLATPRLTLDFSASLTRTVEAGSFSLLTAPPATGVPSSVTDPTGPAPTTPAPGATSPAAPGSEPPPAPVTGATTVPGVNRGRTEALAFTASPRLSYNIDPLTTANAGYVFTRADVSGEAENDQHLFSVGLSRAFGRRDRGAITYSFSYFPEGDQDTQGTQDTQDAQDAQASESETVHTVLLSWTRLVTDALTVSLGAGPQITGEEDTDLAAFAAVNYRLRAVSFSLGYSRTMTVVLGRQGPQDSDTVTAGLAYQATRDLSFSLLASYSLSASRGQSSNGSADSDETTTYGASASASYVINRWATARIAYLFSYEEPSIGGRISHNQVLVGLGFSYPYGFR